RGSGGSTTTTDFSKSSVVSGHGSVFTPLFLSHATRLLCLGPARAELTPPLRAPPVVERLPGDLLEQGDVVAQPVEHFEPVLRRELRARSPLGVQCGQDRTARGAPGLRR